ncbi:hypothetical protein [Streptomyces marianii]|uniref:Uncharacterized protein n=1 Tax=Streptomyces marianii TaxID=1817406 RepID=A0A5R9DWR1_9ACTN|nr:hypothetical protein [Streptomyces marianii]TLQ39302.1 hypothetical protein FEF34_38575 [Streptomyces marianii]
MAGRRDSFLARFAFADPSRHGSSGGSSMGKPARNATEADRQGWEKSDRTNGFSRSARRGRRRS